MTPSRSTAPPPPTSTTSRPTSRSTSITMITHGKVDLALHTLRAPDAPGVSDGSRPLVLLHGLGERTPATRPARVESWPGPIHGLDLTGHGRSTRPTGGGYTAEVLLADVDSAMRSITADGPGQVTLLGRGLGAYLALLAAGARPDLVRGAILADGPGIVGGGVRPGSPFVVQVSEGGGPAAGEEPGGAVRAPDPYALAEMSRDVRPPDYAATWVRHAVEFGSLDTPVAVTAVVRPEWIAGIVAEPGVIECTLAEALARYT